MIDRQDYNNSPEVVRLQKNLLPKSGLRADVLRQLVEGRDGEAVVPGECV